MPQPEPHPDAPVLTSRQRKHLRGLAHDLDPVVLVGEAGLSDGVAAEVDKALSSHELVKIRLRKPEDKTALAAQVAARAGAVACGLVGHTLILYRPHQQRPRIVLPS